MPDLDHFKYKNQWNPPPPAAVTRTEYLWTILNIKTRGTPPRCCYMYRIPLDHFKYKNPWNPPTAVTRTEYLWTILNIKTRGTPPTLLLHVQNTFGPF